jgi:hypothetical protein
MICFRGKVQNKSMYTKLLSGGDHFWCEQVFVVSVHPSDDVDGMCVSGNIKGKRQGLV